MRLLKGTIFSLLGIVAICFLIFAPKPGQSLPKDRVVVEYWEKWTGDESDSMKRIVNEFNRTTGQDKGIYVRYLSMSKIDQKTLAACAAGVPPDIAGLIQRQIVQFAALGVLDPLEDLARARGITADTYKPIYWKACNYDGHLWCLISTPGVVALHYNKAIFRDNAAAIRRAGLDPDRPPATLDELDRMAGVLDGGNPEAASNALDICPVSRAGIPTSPFSGSAGKSSIPSGRNSH